MNSRSEGSLNFILYNLKPFEHFAKIFWSTNCKKSEFGELDVELPSNPEHKISKT